MIYTFKCPNCNNKEEHSILAVDYDNVKDNLECDLCKTILQRSIADDLNTTGTIIPEHMRYDASNKWQPNMNKSNRRKLY